MNRKLNELFIKQFRRYINGRRKYKNIRLRLRILDRFQGKFKRHGRENKERTPGGF